MRSIRLSLIVYFLVLLGGALGVVSLIVYETTRQNLEESQRSMAQLLRDKHQAKLDNFLLKEARSFYKEIQPFTRNLVPRNEPRHWFYKVQPTLGVLAVVAHPNAHLTIPLWQEQEASEMLRDSMSMISSAIKVNVEGKATADQDGHLSDFYQVSNNTEPVWWSSSLKNNRLPFYSKVFADNTPFDWRFDDSTVAGTSVRVVTFGVNRSFQSSLSSGKKGPPSSGKKGPPPPGKKGPPPSGKKGPASIWWNGLTYTIQPQYLYIQAAYDKENKNLALVEMEQELEDDLAKLEKTTKATLTSLRSDLWLSVLVAFGLTVVGGFVLVRFGLMPLRRVSEAVSRVSAKDFRLAVEEARLPNELQLIVRRLKETLEMLRRAFAREKQATADISHELRTPLAALLTTLDVALRKTRTLDEYQDVLNECRLSGQHMYALVERLLVLARLDAGVDQLRLREVDVAQVAEQCATMIRPLAEARGLRLSLYKDGPASMKADPDKLREVFTNLLHNAIEYNKPDGAIDLAVTRDNGDVRVEVRDTGIGMSPDAKQHIFERFYRSDPSRQADGLHAGLGLAIVKGYIELMGGTIDVESVQGEGSTFRLHLPVQSSV